MAEVTNLWRVVQAWMSQQVFPPNQSALAKSIGVERSAVSDWKTGKTKPNPTHLRDLARLMSPTLGPHTHDILLVALMLDMGYDVDPEEGIGTNLGLFLPGPDGSVIHYKDAALEETLDETDRRELEEYRGEQPAEPDAPADDVGA
jgi:transcriptional regulator with XRE-family HTH domain